MEKQYLCVLVTKETGKIKITNKKWTERSPSIFALLT
jgi:hypothetical protein